MYYICEFGGNIMSKIEYTEEETNAICKLFNKCYVALLRVKTNENGEKYIEKVYIDGRKFNIPSTDLSFQISLCQGAVDLIREKGSILKLSKEEQNFVIKNHPSWIMLRDTFDFNGELDHELSGAVRTELKLPYEMWSKDFCDSIGEKKFYPQKNMKALLVTYKEFAALFRMDRNRVQFPIGDDCVITLPKNVSNLQRGFFEAVRVREEKNPNLKVELGKYGYPEVYYNQNGKWMKIDVSTEEGLKKLLLISPSPIRDNEVTDKPVLKVKKKRPTKGKKNKR